MKKISRIAALVAVVATSPAAFASSVTYILEQAWSTVPESKEGQATFGDTAVVSVVLGYDGASYLHHDFTWDDIVSIGVQGKHSDSGTPAAFGMTWDADFLSFSGHDLGDNLFHVDGNGVWSAFETDNQLMSAKNASGQDLLFSLSTVFDSGNFALKVHQSLGSKRGKSANGEASIKNWTDLALYDPSTPLVDVVAPAPAETALPEPSPLALSLVGLVALFAASRRNIA